MFWRKEVLHNILTSCIIMHNMIIEDERNIDALIQDALEDSISAIYMKVDKNYQIQ